MEQQAVRAAHRRHHPPSARPERRASRRSRHAAWAALAVGALGLVAACASGTASDGGETDHGGQAGSSTAAGGTGASGNAGGAGGGGDAGGLGGAAGQAGGAGNTGGTGTGASAGTGGAGASGGSGGCGGQPPGMDPSLDLPDPCGQTCTGYGYGGDCPSLQVCRIWSATLGRCEGCSPCGNLHASCGSSSECDILFQCYAGQCRNFCDLAYPQMCGNPSACVDVGNDTFGICDN